MAYPVATGHDWIDDEWVRVSLIHPDDWFSMTSYSLPVAGTDDGGETS